MQKVRRLPHSFSFVDAVALYIHRAHQMMLEGEEVQEVIQHIDSLENNTQNLRWFQQ